MDFCEAGKVAQHDVGSLLKIISGHRTALLEPAFILGSPWELLKNTDPQAPPQTNQNRNFGGTPRY